MLESITKDISLRKFVYNCGAFIGAAYVSFFKVTLLKHTKSLKQVIFQVGKCPILEYFHEIQFDDYNYAKT